MDLNKIARILKEYCKLDPEGAVVIGISGGADSLSLLDIMDRLHYTTIPVHLDHMLRPESKEESEKLSAMLGNSNRVLIVGRKNVKKLAVVHQMSIEEAAREVRYQFLFEQARLFHAQAVAVGHNADDQVETLLMHLLRGTGLSGLQGMLYCTRKTNWDRGIPLIRPLLDVWREEIVRYCHERGFSPIEDQSNYDTLFLRNRVRFSLIPELEENYNPQVKRALFRMSKTIQGDVSIIDNVMEDIWRQSCLEQTWSYIRFDLHQLQMQTTGMQRNLIRRVLRQLSENSEEIGFDQIDEVVGFLCGPTSKDKEFMSAVGAVVIDEQIVFFRKGSKEWLKRYPQLDTSRQFLPTDAVRLGNHWRLVSEVIQDTASIDLKQEYKNPFSALLDLNKLTFPLIIRKPMPGERFYPFGLEGKSIKLSDFFINEKLPRKARENYPLVYSADVIAWIPGFRIGHPFHISEKTEKIVLLRIERREK